MKLGNIIFLAGQTEAEYNELYVCFLTYVVFAPTGRENAGGGRGNIRHPLATLPRHVGVQQFRHHVLESKFHGPLVPHVRQNLRLHQQVKGNLK